MKQASAHCAVHTFLHMGHGFDWVVGGGVNSQVVGGECLSVTHVVAAARFDRITSKFKAVRIRAMVISYCTPSHSEQRKKQLHRVFREIKHKNRNTTK